MCVFRLESGRPYGQSWRSDEGRTWTRPVAMDGVFSVQPSLAVLADGTVLLSGGRPCVFLWVNRDGTGRDWQAVDLRANHNRFVPDEPIRDPSRQSSCYTEVVPVAGRAVLCIYDRIPHGWSAIPKDSRDANSVWVVRVSLESAEP